MLLHCLPLFGAHSGEMLSASAEVQHVRLRIAFELVPSHWILRIGRDGDRQILQPVKGRTIVGWTMISVSP